MLCLVARLVTVLLVAKRTCRAEATQDEKYEDLIYTSMKSIVSLDELVTELAVQVAKLTTSLSVIQVHGEQTRKDLEHTKTKIAALEDYGMTVLEKKFEKLTSSFSTMKENVGEIRQDVDLTETKVADLEEKGVPALENKIDQLTTSVSETIAKVEEIDEEVTVVGGEDEAGASKCMKVCAGTTGRQTTNWINYKNVGMYTDVDIGNCGFVKTPTVTTSLEGTSSHWTADGTSAVYNVSPTTFRIYISTSVSVSQAKSYKYNVEWISVGYTC